MFCRFPESSPIHGFELSPRVAASCLDQELCNLLAFNARNSRHSRCVPITATLHFCATQEPLLCAAMLRAKITKRGGCRQNISILKSKTMNYPETSEISLCDRHRSPFHLLSFPLSQNCEPSTDFSAPPPYRRGAWSRFSPPLFLCYRSVFAAAHRWSLRSSSYNIRSSSSGGDAPGVFGSSQWTVCSGYCFSECGLNSAMLWLLVKPTPPIGWHPKMAITPLWTTQDERRNSRPHPRDEFCQLVVGRASHPWRMPELSVGVSRATVARYLPRHPKALSRLGPAFCTARIADPFIFPIVVLSCSHNVLLGANPH